MPARPNQRQPDAGELTSDRTEYAQRWPLNADHHVGRGDYAWMADQLAELVPTRLIDVGTGTGDGLVELVRRYRPARAIGIEKNTALAKAAVRKLRGISPVGFADIMVERAMPDQREFYTTEFTDREIATRKSVQILRTDFLLDPYLPTRINEEVQREGPFDAVTMWLSGTDIGFIRTLEVFRLGVEDRSRYREVLQERAIIMAAAILRPGGAIQIVDRVTGSGHTDLMDRYSASMARYAAALGMEMSSIAYRPYSEPESPGAMVMVRHQGHPDRTMSDQLQLMSLILRRGA